MITFSNEELERAKPIAAGDKIPCARCSRNHVVASSEGDVLQFIRCRGTAYLVGVKGKAV